MWAIHKKLFENSLRIALSSPWKLRSENCWRLFEPNLENHESSCIITASDIRCLGKRDSWGHCIRGKCDILYVLNNSVSLKGCYENFKSPLIGGMFPTPDLTSDFRDMKKIFDSFGKNLIELYSPPFRRSITVIITKLWNVPGVTVWTVQIQIESMSGEIH